MDIQEPQISYDDILVLTDSLFNSNNVCVVTGAGSGIGRATAVAAAANKLMTVGLDIDEVGGKETQKIAQGPLIRNHGRDVRSARHPDVIPGQLHAVSHQPQVLGAAVVGKL